MTFESLLKTVTDAYHQDHPFVAYRSPNKTLVKALVQPDRQLHISKQYDEGGFIFAPFNTEEQSILIPFEGSDYTEALFEQLDYSSDDFFFEQPSEIARKEHIDLVRKGIRHIDSGAAKKIVLSRKETIVLPDFSPIMTFSKLLNTYQNAFVYLWYHPKKGLWLGATPEKLITIKNNKFTTVSLAGTQTFQGTDVVDWGTKEIEEQQIVTRYITSNLESLTRDISIGNVTTVRAGNLLHLSTEIWGTLQSVNDLKLVVNHLHPTPAICGMPKLAAKKFIIDNEGYDREFYTGFLGEINMHDISNLFVNLRCMKVEETGLNLFLGGGITQESVPENEWQETLEKSKVMKRVL